MINNGIQSYRKINITTADPGELVLMCYNAAIDQIKIAIKKYQDKDFEGKCKALQKAQDIIDELRCSLDFEKGGEIARNLESLYNYMARKLILSDINKNLNGLNEIIGILGELKSAWEIVFKKQKTMTQSKTFKHDIENQPQRLNHISA